MAQTQRGRERETVVSGGKGGGYFSVPDLGQSDLSRDAVRGSAAAGSHKPGCEWRQRRAEQSTNPPLSGELL